MKELPPQKRTDAFCRSLRLPGLALRWHWRSVLCALISAVICWYLNYTEVSIIDPMIFKSIFIIFGFTLGFRNVRANQRRNDALHQISNMFSAMWSIYVGFPSTSRQNVRQPLLEALRAMATHIEGLASYRQNHVYGLVGLEPLENASKLKRSWLDCIFGMTPQGFTKKAPSFDNVQARSLISPHPLLFATLTLCEAELEQIEPDSSEQKLRRTFWSQKSQLLSSIDKLVSLTVPSVSCRFVTFVDMTMFLFAVVLPWGITSKLLFLNANQLSGTNWRSGLFLGLNTLFITMVMFGINSLSAETEDPLTVNEDNVRLSGFVELFAEGVADYDVKRERAERPSAGGAEKSDAYDAVASWELVVKQHAEICFAKSGEV